ncbi:MAG: holo-ACP synthase [Gammaproteobacteria bacterium]
MIYGIGVDMVHIPRIAAALSRFGERFAQRVLSDAELQACWQTSRTADFLAKHFAAKEAWVKALGTGFRGGLSWREIEIRNDPLGKPYLTCVGRAQEMLAERSIGESYLSLSDEGQFAIAFVVLLLRP